MSDADLLEIVRSIEKTCGKPILEIASEWQTVKRGLDYRNWHKKEPSLSERVERLCEAYAPWVGK